MGLSAGQKAANKLARKERDQAFRLRRSEIDAAEHAAEAAIKAEFDRPIEEAIAAREAATGRRNEAQADIDRQIDALRQRRIEIDVEHAPSIEATRRDASRIVDTRNAAMTAMKSKLYLDFPDFADGARWSPAAWEAQRKKMGL
jgi:hypothetical protein